MDKIIKAGVIGHPIAHSKSPFIHKYWLKKYNIMGEYLRYDIAPDEFQYGVSRLVNLGLRGFNVTIPYKEKIMDLCRTHSPIALKIGAANTVTINDQGMLHADSTDGFGYMSNISAHLPHFSFMGKTVLILGAGGAARAIIGALIESNTAKIMIANRTMARAQAMACEFSERYMSETNLVPLAWFEIHDILGQCDAVINTTSLGMSGQPPLEIDLKLLDCHAIVSDIVYAPLETDILKQAKTLGLQSVTGIGMLLHQARPGFERWFGVDPEVDNDLERIVLSS